VWLRNVREVVDRHKEELVSIANIDRRVVRAVEFNVREQVERLMVNKSVAEGVRSGRLKVYGLVYEVGRGLLREVSMRRSPVGVYRND